MGMFDLLEDFAEKLEAGSNAVKSSENLALEESKLEAFERGYTAGWEDASDAQDSRTGQVSDALDANLQELSFTYHEALNQMSENLKPVLQCLFDEILPLSMRATLAPRMVDEITRLAQTAISAPVVLFVANGQKDTVLSLLARDHQMPLDVRESDELAEDDVRLRLDATTYEIDAETAISAIKNAVDDYLFYSRMEVQNAKSA